MSETVVRDPSLVKTGPVSGEPTLVSPYREITKDAYHMTPEALDTMEVTIAQTLSEKTGLDSGIAVLMVDGQSAMADFGRTCEQDIFTKAGEDYDFHQGMMPYEDRSTFIYTVDLDLGRVAHVKRVVGPLEAEDREQSGVTGLEVIDDRIRAVVPEQQATLDEMTTHHSIDDLSKCINITTNLNTKRGENNFFEKPYSLVSYKAVFGLVERDDLTHLFAYMNQKAIRSLPGGLGVQYDLLNGKEYHLPMPDDPAKSDNDYLAVVLPNTQSNRDAFTKTNPDFPGTALIADREVAVAHVTREELTQDAQPKSFKTDIKEVWSVGRKEVLGASLGKRAVLGASIAGFAFEWGTGNEALMGVVGAHVIDKTGNALMTAAATGSASFAEQTIIGASTLASMHLFPNVMEKAREKWHSKEGETTEDSQGLGDRFLTAFSFGTSITAMNNNRKKELTAKENAKNLVVDAGLIGSGIAAIGAAACGLTNAGKALGLQGETDFLIDVMKFPGTYVGLLGLRTLLRSRKNRRSNPEPQPAAA